MRIFEIIFSPTGGTQKCADIFAAAFGKEVELIDLADFSYDFTATDITSEDICIIAAPAFGGRIPEVAATRLKSIKGNGAKAILIAVYGNREFDDCLVELQDIAAENGLDWFGGGWEEKRGERAEIQNKTKLKHPGESQPFSL